MAFLAGLGFEVKTLRTLAEYVVWPAVLGGTLLIQAVWFNRTTSATFDEVSYVDAGLRFLQTGNFEGLVRQRAAPLPVVISCWAPALLTGGPDSPGYDRMPGLVTAARWAYAALAGVPLVLTVYAWLAQRDGPATAMVGGALVALSPTVVAHASVATTDACFAFFALVALAAMRRYAAWPSRANLALLSVGLGLALSSKQSAVFLWPVAAVVLFEVASTSTPRSTGHVLFSQIAIAGRRLALVTVGAMVLAWGLFGFQVFPADLPAAERVGAVAHAGAPTRSTRPSGVAAFPLPAPLHVLRSQALHAAKGHDAFLLGKRSRTGWWAFFPVAFAVKSTYAELSLAVAFLALLTRRWAWHDPSLRLWFVASLTYAALALCSPLNLGHRYLLMLYPLITLCAIDGGARALSGRPKLKAVAAAALLFVQGAAAAGIAPHYLSYFNGLAGGPARAHEVLVDSSLDWGQDLPALRGELTRLGGGKVILAYFGQSSPRAYRVPVTAWRDPDEALANGARHCAVSVTLLHGLYVPNDLFAAFRPLRPEGRAGYSILIYDLNDPDVRAAVRYVNERLNVPMEPPAVSGPSRGLRESGRGSSPSLH